jgi:hypothetical protein
LEQEEEMLKSQIKDEMIRLNTKEVVLDNIIVKLQIQNRIEIDDDAIPFFKENGYSYLIIEKCDQVKFKEMFYAGAFKADYDCIKVYIKRKVLHYLYVKTGGK